MNENNLNVIALQQTLMVMNEGLSKLAKHITREDGYGEGNHLSEPFERAITHAIGIWKPNVYEQSKSPETLTQ